MSTPDLTQKVRGFRQWTIHQGQLVALGRGRIYWTPGMNEARCFPMDSYNYGSYMLSCYSEPVPPKGPCDKCPGHGCECGLYALGEFQDDWLRKPGRGGGSRWCCGVVLGWGRMEVHKTGWRAQFAEPVVLAYDHLLGRKHVERVLRVATAYGVQAVEIHELAAVAEEYGELLPESLMPEDPPPPPPPLPPLDLGEQKNHVTLSRGVSADAERLAQQFARMVDEKASKKPWYKL